MTPSDWIAVLAIAMGCVVVPVVAWLAKMNNDITSMKQQVRQLEALDIRVSANHDDVTGLKTEQATLKEQSKTTFRILSKIEDGQKDINTQISRMNDTIQKIFLKLN